MCSCVDDVKGTRFALERGYLSARLCACMEQHECLEGDVWDEATQRMGRCSVCFTPRRVVERLNRAKIPAAYRAFRLATFPVHSGAIDAWSAAAAVSQGGGCAIYGPATRGKTGLLVGALVAAAEYAPVRYHSWLELVPLYGLRTFKPEREALERLTEFPGVLALDDLRAQGDLADAALGEVLHRRSDRELPTIAATALTPAVLGENVAGIHRLGPWVELKGPALPRQAAAAPR